MNTLSHDLTTADLKARKVLDILLIEDDEEYVHLIREHLSRGKAPELKFVVQKNLQEGIAFARENRVDAVLLDLFLPDSRGLDTVKSFCISAPQLPVIVMTSLDDEATAVEAVRHGAQDYLRKDQISGPLLTRTVRYSIERHQIKSALGMANMKLGNFNVELEKQVHQRTAELEERNTELKHEITERELAEKHLMESEQNYTHLVRGLKDHAVFLLNANGNILVWNPGAELITGYKASEVLGEQVSRLFGSKEPRLQLRDALDQVGSAGTFQTEGWAGRKDGQPFWAETSLSKLVDGKGKMMGVSVIIRDATQRRRNEDVMKASLKEKEVLLKEIHHRVKNNLQVISSLLRLQSETVQDKKTATLFLDSQERVRAMAMVHEYLYKSNDLSKINFPAYVASLVRNIYRTFGLTASVPPKVEVADVLLSLDVAVPCGLLLTELISNAVKYAYPDKKGGPLDVRFRQLAEGCFELSVADQGVGFPKNFDWMKAESLGLRLVRLLTEQLQGEILLENKNGIKIIVTFKDSGGG